MKSIKHFLSHAFGLNAQRVFSRREGHKLIIGVRCETCGKVTSQTEYASIYGSEA